MKSLTQFLCCALLPLLLIACFSNEGGISGTIGIASRNYELYYPFAISGTDKINYNKFTNEITVNGVTEQEQKVFTASETGVTLIQDINKNYFLVDPESTDNTVTTTTAPAGLLDYDFGSNLNISLDSFSLRFHQNQAPIFY